jgi:hypothetical protein
MTMRAKKLAERQAANVVANQKGRPSRQVKHNDASALDQSSRTLSSKERAKMMQAKRCGSSSSGGGGGSSRGSIAAPDIRSVVGGGMRSSSGGGSSSSSNEGYTIAARTLRQHDRPERQERHTARRTPLKSLLEFVGLRDKLHTFEEHRITYDVLAGATDALLRELLEDPKLGLEIGERAALRSELQKHKGSEASGSDGAAGGMHEDVSRRPPRRALRVLYLSCTHTFKYPGCRLQTLATSWMVENFSEIEYDAHGGYLSKGVSGSVYKAQWQGQNCAVRPRISLPAGTSTQWLAKCLWFGFYSRSSRSSIMLVETRKSRQLSRTR